MIATLKPIAFWSGTHSVHYLNPDDIPQVQELLERCQEFWWISEGRPVPADAASSNFADAPPGYDQSRMIFLGIYSPAGRLVGLLSTAPDYPEVGAWYIGLMVLEWETHRYEQGARLARERIHTYAQTHPTPKHRVQ